MEENISQTPIPVTTESTSAPPVSKPPFGSWWKVGMLVVGTLLMAGGLFFAGYQYSRRQSPKISYPTITPTPVTQINPTPTPDETANWKTYTNAKYGYSVSYPKDWIIQNENLAVDSVTTRTKLQSADFIIGEPTMGGHYIPGAESGALLEIVVSLNPNFKSYEDFKSFEETKSTKFPLNYFSSVDNDAVIGGIKATKKLGGKPYKGWQSYAYTFDNGTIYEIYLTSSNNQQVLFDQILFTFKFTQ